MWSVPRICWSLHHLSCSSSDHCWSQAMNFVIPWALILILLPIHHRANSQATPSFETFTSPLRLSSLQQLSSFLAYLCRGTVVWKVFWWYWHWAPLLHRQRNSWSIIWSSLLHSTGLSFGLFTNLCLHLCSVFVLLLLLLIAKRCKNTHAIFQQLSKETMQERDPSRGSPNAATKVIKTSYLWRYLQRQQQRSKFSAAFILKNFFQARFTTNYSNFYLSSHSKGQNLEMQHLNLLLK